MTNVRKITLLIPSEARTREFDAKLLLACFAAERGHDCLVGSRMAIHQAIGALPVGLYVAKDMFRSSATILSILAGLGHDIVGWDEESLVYVSEESYLRHRVSSQATRWMRRVFAWGEEDRAMKARAEAFRGIPIEAVGNPRMDLLRPELRAFFAHDAELLRKHFGRFILVNSNFGRLNHLLPAQRIVPSRMDAAGRAALAGSGLPFEYWQFRERVFHAFREMVPALADRFRDCHVVLRPHPSEDPKAWRDTADACNNVTVTNEGPATAWLMAAETVIHNGCTTGVEAYLLDRPVICYQPEKHPLYDLDLPNGVSDSAADLAELLSLTAAMLAGARRDDAQPAKAAFVRRYISALDGPLASERILAAIERHMETSPPPAPSARGRRAAARIAWGRRLHKQINAAIPGSKNSPWYTRKRFADLELDEVTSRMARLAAMLGRFDGLRAEKLRSNVYRIFRP